MAKLYGFEELSVWQKAEYLVIYYREAIQLVSIKLLLVFCYH